MRDLIWAGSDTGLIHLTRDGGKNWKNVTPTGITNWSKISLIEASHFDPSVAYAAVDRSRLDDQAPYIYRTRDYGATWQPIVNGIAPTASCAQSGKTRKRKGLLFAGTELGVYVSFDDGDHWQPLQLNLPVTSVRDLTVHGDDLIVATHGGPSGFSMTSLPCARCPRRRRPRHFGCIQPATAYRVDNDSFQGTPIPPEEPTAENPAERCSHRLSAQVAGRKFSSKFSMLRKIWYAKFHRMTQFRLAHPPLPVAERWFSKPESLEKTAGMHRFVWNLAWRSSGGPGADEESEDRNSSGPKAVPGLL